MLGTLTYNLIDLCCSIMSEGENMSKKLVINPRMPKGEDGYKTFSVRIKSELVENLDELALTTGRSRNQLIGIMIQFALENFVVEECETYHKRKRFG